MREADIATHLQEFSRQLGEIHGRQIDLADRMGNMEGRIESIDERVDAVHTLARATNGRVNAHDLRLHEFDIAARTRRQVLEEVELERREHALKHERRRATRRSWLQPLATGSGLTLLGLLAAHFIH